MKVCLLASGSKGNAILVETGQTRILVDAGLSAKQLRKRLESVSVDAASLSALLVTHEHSDHIRGLGPLVRQLGLPVYLHTNLVGRMKDVGRTESVREFSDGEEFTVDGVNVNPFSITHDSVAPVGFTLNGEEGKVGVATDLGVVTRLVTECLEACRVLVVETNHDEEMLRDGPYPWALKQRVRSYHGHLSNTAGGQLLKSLLWPGLESVFLGHLSETNNRPELALNTATRALDSQSICCPDVFVGKQHSPVFWTT